MRPLSEVMADGVAGKYLDPGEVQALAAALQRSLEREHESKTFYLASQARYHRMFEGVRKALGTFYDYDVVKSVERVVWLAGSPGHWISSKNDTSRTLWMED